MFTRWQYLLYPDLQRFDLRDQDRALEKARDGTFDGIEIIGICVGLALTAILTRYSASEMGLVQRIGAVLANFLIAVPLLMFLVGPFFIRRTRRHLLRLLKRRGE